MSPTLLSAARSVLAALVTLAMLLGSRRPVAAQAPVGRPPAAPHTVVIVEDAAAPRPPRARKLPPVGAPLRASSSAAEPRFREAAALDARIGALESERPTLWPYFTVAAAGAATAAFGVAYLLLGVFLSMDGEDDSARERNERNLYFRRTGLVGLAGVSVAVAAAVPLVLRVRAWRGRQRDIELLREERDALRRRAALTLELRVSHREGSLAVRF